MDNKPVLVILVGLPRSGKSSYAKQYQAEHPNTVIHSSDAIRTEIYGSRSDNSDNVHVFDVLHGRIFRDLKAGMNVVFDACNISSKRRLWMLRQLTCRNIETTVEFHFIATPFEQCLKNNAECPEEEKVPTFVIDRMRRNFCVPWELQGQCTKIIRPHQTEGLEVEFFVDQLLEFSQDNSHHRLTLGDHLLATHEFVFLNKGNLPLQLAAILHDCGKPESKSFVTPKGEETAEAHYYDHHNIGAYKILSGDFKLEVDDYELLEIATIVQYHMRPFMAWDKSDKTLEKDKKYLGHLYESVLKIHDADVAAH